MLRHLGDEPILGALEYEVSTAMPSHCHVSYHDGRRLTLLRARCPQTEFYRAPRPPTLRERVHFMRELKRLGTTTIPVLCWLREVAAAAHPAVHPCRKEERALHALDDGHGGRLGGRDCHGGGRVRVADHGHRAVRHRAQGDAGAHHGVPAQLGRRGRGEGLPQPCVVRHDQEGEEDCSKIPAVLSIPSAIADAHPGATCRWRPSTARA